MYSFLESFPNHILAVIMPDGKGGTKIQHNISIAEAEELNELRKKGDIYFTPNGDYSLIFGDQKINAGRTAKNAKNIYAFIVDIDSKDELWKNYEGLDQPSWVIETGHGHHLYYVLEKPLSYSDYEKEFKDIESKLVVLMKGDPKCTDISRILRVPGFKYWKDNKGEIEIKVKEQNPIVFKYSEFSNIVSKYYASAGRDIEERKVLTKKIKDKTLAKSFDDFFDEVQRIDVADIIGDLFSQYDIRNGGAIYEGGKRTDGYKYCKRGNYVNTFSANDRPVGGPYSVAKFYYKSTPDIIEYFRDRWHIEFKRLSDVKNALSRDVKEVKLPSFKEGDKPDVQVGDPTSGIRIEYRNNRVMQYYDKGESEYINGAIEAYGFYKTGDTIRYIVKTYKGGSTEIRTLPMIGGGSDLRKFLMSAGLIVGESKQGLVWLLKYLVGVKKEYIYVDTLGLQMVNGKKIVVSKGGVYLDEENLLFVNIPEITGEFIYNDTENTVEIKDFIVQLMEGYNGNISFVSFLSILIGINVWFFRNRKPKKIAVPQFFLMGLSQTGKSTYLDYLFKQGLGISLEMAAQSKPFVYQKMAKNYMPIHFGEYRNTSNVKEEIEGQMRILFDGTQGTKGKADQSVVYYPNNAVYMLDGQSTFTDDAALTRLFLLIANPKDKGDLNALETLPNIFNKTIEIFKDQEDFEKFVKLCREKRKIIKKTMTLSRDNDRMLDGYSYLYGLSDWLLLTEYDHFIDATMQRQNNYLSVDDIKMTYQKAFNLQQMLKFSASIYKRGLVIEIIPEYLKTNNTDDFRGIIKTVNQHFLQDEYPFIGMEVYIDLQYIYDNKDLWNQFIRTLRRVDFEGDYSPEERKTIGGIKAFVEQNFAGSPMLQELNFEFNSVKHKDEKPKSKAEKLF